MVGDHYKKLTLEPIDIMRQNFTHQEFVGFCKGNIIKYILRDKGNYPSDVKKARNYCDYLIAELESPNKRMETRNYENKNKTISE